MLHLKFNPEYPYVYETHFHTCEGSACARDTGAEIAEACKKAGYTGVVVTDHFFYGNTAVDRSLPWEEWVHEFCKGYYSAKEYGDANDFQVFFGWESCYNATEFLIYGLSPEWLLAHPEIKDATIQEQFEMVHRDGGFIVHAHPYREEAYIPEIRLFPDYVDAVEGINASHASLRSRSHNNPEFDVRAQAYAKEHGLPMTAGSDVHGTDLLLGGMAFKKKWADIHDFAKIVKSKGDYLLLTGNE